MIDNVAIFIFGSLIVYSVYRAVKLDRVLVWFSSEAQQVPLPPPKKFRK